MKPDDKSLLCLSCGLENASGPFCCNCRNPLQIEAGLLPELVQERLRLEGFKVASSLQNAQLESDLSKAFPESDELKLSQVLTLPELTSERTVTMTIAVVVRASIEAIASLHELSEIMLGTIQSFIVSTNAQIGSVFINVYMIYTEGISLSYMKKHRLPLRLRRRRLKKGSFLWSMALIALKPIDGTTGQWRYLNRFVTDDLAVRSAARQRAQVENSDETKQIFFKYVFGYLVLKFFGQIIDYLRLLSLLGEHEILALKIRNDQLTAGDLTKAVALSAVVAAVFTNLLNVKTGTIETGLEFDFLNSVLNGIFIMLVYLLAAALIHWPLRLAGGKASFRNTFTANTLVSATCYPIVALFVGILIHFGVDEVDAWTNSQISTAGISLLVLAPTHEIKWSRAFVALFVTLPFVLMAVAGIVFIFFAIIAQT